MAKFNTSGMTGAEFLNVDFMRSLVKQYSELGQWTSAFFWADAAAAASGNEESSGDNIWLLASTMLARGELHRAAHTVASRNLHRTHLLCLGVAMRAYIAAKEPSSALALLEETDPVLLEPKDMDQTHNRALASVLVTQARALSLLERREAAAEALAAAIRTDVTCYEALDLLLEQHAFTPRQEKELIESLPIGPSLNAAEQMYIRNSYKERLLRYSPLPETPPAVESDCPITRATESVRTRSSVGKAALSCRLVASSAWNDALTTLDSIDPWCEPDLRASCLLELRKSSDLFTFAHSLVDAYPNTWTAWYAVGLYYYLIGKSEFARRYLTKAKSLEPGAGCVWLAYGHSFAVDNEHDQAMAAYFKASQLMPGCYLPPLYVGVECSLLNNVSMAQRFLLRAAVLHSDEEEQNSSGCGWSSILSVVRSPRVAHESGSAALAAGDHSYAYDLYMKAVELLPKDLETLNPCWAATLEGLAEACRRSGRLSCSVLWLQKALGLRPERAHAYTALGLVLATLGKENMAADLLHTALSKDPDDAVALSLLDAIVDKIDAALTDEEIPQFPFPSIVLPEKAPVVAATPTQPETKEQTIVSDMSMSFD